MRHRLRRVGWWFRRLRAKRLLGFSVLVVAAAAGGWLYGGPTSAAVGGVVALVVVGIVLAKPVRAIASRLFLRTPPWQAEPGPLAFAGADLGFTVDGFAAGETPRELVDTISAAGGRFESGEISLELWLVASDKQGQDWTIVQELSLPPAGKKAWTSSVDGELAFADFDETGRPNPFRATHRLAKSELDVPLVDIDILGWGREQLHPVGTRDTVVVFARTSVAAEKLSGFEYPESREERMAHLVPVDLEGIAKSLGWGHPVHWRGGAVFGLLELLEHYEPGAWAALEEKVAPRWYEKGMFARVERGTEKATERALAASS
ncbi:MAG: hypothetical protein EX267_04560 [Acidimicrobiia bacterium]|nr:MAG: hypothetical protein EX267_04560 [Acidimicrobiia bacterium]